MQFVPGNLGSGLSTRQTALRRLILAAALCLTVHVPAAMAQLPAVRIAAWEQSANGTGVVFKPLVASAVSDGGPALPNETEGGLFEYGLDTSDIKWADECRCHQIPRRGRIA